MQPSVWKVTGVLSEHTLWIIEVSFVFFTLFWSSSSTTPDLSHDCVHATNVSCLCIFCCQRLGCVLLPKGSRLRYSWIPLAFPDLSTESETPIGLDRTLKLCCIAKAIIVASILVKRYLSYVHLARTSWLCC